MKHIFTPFLVLLLSLSIFSCIKDEPKNNECDILSAWVEGSEYSTLFHHPGQMRIDNILSDQTEIVFTVKSTIDLPEIPIYFNITPGATIEPSSGSLQNFSNGPVTYTVTSEDGAYKRTYRVSFQEAEMPSFNFHFEYVDTAHTMAGSGYYHVFYELDSNNTRQNIWATGNPGVGIVRYDYTPEQFTVYSTPNGYQGKGVCLNTQDAGPLGQMMHKPIAAGSLFLGSFDLNQVLVNALRATRFGIPIDKEPVRATGYYKYQPGEKFTDANMDEVSGRTDQANIYAVFFRNQDADGNSVVLYGDNVLSSDLIVSKAQVASLPATNEWTRFEMFFEGSAADPAILANMGYSFTLVFSSSKDGDNFEGAIGSTLYIDEVEVEFKN